MKMLLTSGVEAGNKVKAVREVVKTYTTQKQDMYDDTAEILKPSIEVQKTIKESIDNKQDELIKQLQENQKALTSGLEDIIIYNQLPEKPLQETKLPIDYKPAMMDELQPKYKSDLDKGFNPADIQTLIKYKLFTPSDVLKEVQNENLDFDDYDANVGKIIQNLGGQKGALSKTKKTRDSNKKQINELTNEIKTIQKYRQRIAIIPEGLDTIGSGIYTQKKRNAYKIDPQGGQYGSLIIDLPKLYGHLKVVAHKNGQKVYDKQADFDTLDLLTKRFNNQKNYSELARSVFNDLNRLSEIPIHRTSKKFSKIGSGVVYYSNPNDLLSRLELLGGSMSAGNNSSDVREEFVKIVHKLNELNVLDNKQMNDLMKEYLI